MESPCINVCIMNEDGTCEGCGRTIQEIASWARMSREERVRVMAELPQRRLKQRSG